MDVWRFGKIEVDGWMDDGWRQGREDRGLRNIWRCFRGEGGKINTENTCFPGVRWD